jgi:hypothetical protein
MQSQGIKEEMRGFVDDQDLKLLGEASLGV